MPVREIPGSMDDQALAFCRALHRNMQTSSYPLLETQADLEAEYKKSAAHPGGFRVMETRRGTLCGVMFGFAEADSRYLQTTGFYVAEGDSSAADALSAWLGATYAGFTAHIGLPAANTTIVSVLQSGGYTLLEDSLDLRLDAREFRKAAPGTFAVRRISKAALAEYLAFHELRFGDCYWNAARVQETFADWHVYALDTQEAISGGLFLRMFGGCFAEIYGLYAESEAACTALLSRAVGELLIQNTQISSIIFMADTVDRPATAAALSLGFKQHSHYRCYTMVL